MQIREGKIDDIEQIVVILEQIAKMHYNNRPEIFKEKTKNEIKKNAIEMLNDEDRKVIVAIDEELKIYGLIVYRIKEVKGHINLNDSKVLWVEELGVDERYRKNGIGKMLMNKVEEDAKKLDCKRIELNCWNFNENAIGFYERFGMKTQRRIMEKEI